MLAYRHAFHAGNHADVLKHLVLINVLQYLVQKPTPLAVLDTHAGAGGYSLESAYAGRTGEAQHGIGLLWPLIADPALPTPLRDYLALVKRFNRGGTLKQYPGSPAIALDLLRPMDSLSLYELHTTDERVLRGLATQGGGGSADTRVQLGDGFMALARELPPPSRRGLVLIDPSYEIKTDYVRVLGALRECLRRFATATVIIWFPQLQTLEARQLPKRLATSAAAAPKGWLLASMTVASGDRDGFGLSGSGVLVCNPPFQLARQLRETLPLVVEHLGRSPDAGFSVREGDASSSGSKPARGAQG